MATFVITTPKDVAASELVVQGNATNVISQGVIVVQGIGVLTPVANTAFTTMTYSPDTKFSIEKAKEFTKVRLRPASGQVYPRTV